MSTLETFAASLSQATNPVRLSSGAFAVPAPVIPAQQEAGSQANDSRARFDELLQRYTERANSRADASTRSATSDRAQSIKRTKDAAASASKSRKNDADRSARIADRQSQDRTAAADSQKNVDTDSQDEPPATARDDSDPTARDVEATDDEPSIDAQTNEQTLDDVTNVAVEEQTVDAVQDAAADATAADPGQAVADDPSAKSDTQAALAAARRSGDLQGEPGQRSGDAKLAGCRDEPSDRSVERVVSTAQRTATNESDTVGRQHSCTSRSAARGFNAGIRQNGFADRRRQG
jgi:hypothetical protein